MLDLRRLRLLRELAGEVLAAGDAGMGWTIFAAMREADAHRPSTRAVLAALSEAVPQ